MSIAKSVAEKLRANNDFILQVGNTLDEGQLKDVFEDTEKLEGQENVGEGEIYTSKTTKAS